MPLAAGLFVRDLDGRRQSALAGGVDGQQVAVFVGDVDFLREADQHPGLGLFVFLVPLLQLLEPVAQLRDGVVKRPGRVFQLHPADSQFFGPQLAFLTCEGDVCVSHVAHLRSPFSTLYTKSIR